MSPREVFEAYFGALTRQDFESAVSLLHPDFYEDYPQSGERIRGAANLRATVENYPGGLELEALAEPAFHGDADDWAIAPNYSVVRVTDHGDTGAGVVRIRYPDGSEWWAINLFEIKDGLLYRQTTFFAAPFEAPAWREPYAERIEP
jgi:hypothetical protein